MKSKLIAIAITTAAAAPAFALTPVDAANAYAAGNYIQSNSNTAGVNMRYSAFRRLCTNDVIAMTASSKGALKNGMLPGDIGWGNYMGYACTLRGVGDAVWGELGVSAPAMAGKVVLYLESVSGGSAYSMLGMDSNAVYQKPFLGTVTNGVLNLATCVNTGYVTGPTSPSATDGGVPIYSGCGATQKRQGQGGFSDLEKQVFPVLNTLVLDFNLTDIDVTPVAAGQSFGIAVSRPLFDAMVAVQNPADGIPSISTREYASLVHLNPFSPTKADWSFLVGDAGGAKTVKLCRRQDTSGTQIASDIYFLSNPCAGYLDNPGASNPATLGLPAINPPIVPIDATGDASETFHIVEAASMAGVKDCLNGYNVNSQGTRIAGTNADWAIGVLSMENNPSVSDTWKYIKLDGVTPYDGGLNNAQTLAGRYNFAYQMVLHTHPTRTPPKAAELLEVMVAVIGSPVVLPEIKSPGVFRTIESLGIRNNACSDFLF